MPALWERLFYAGRYHFLSSSCGLTPPDLLGIWTGDCNAGWGGYYHLDANLNLQVSGGNIGAMPEAMEGYFHLNEAWRKDFETNAAKLLGCRGMLACGNTPGISSGLMGAINTYYPYHYATGEAAWLLYPFWEHYLITEDKGFLRDRLFPLLKSMGEFYEDFLEYKDSAGCYILAGSVSPENQPSNLPVSLLNNSAFDVAGARFLLSALLQACDVLGEEAGKARWQALLDGLPPYLFNQDGALKEWGWPGLDENYGHRHSSHLVSVWPYREISPHRDCALYAAACEALARKDRYSYGDAGHGFLHAAYIAAGLHKAESLQRKIIHLLKSGFYYSSLCTSHFGGHQVFCTDVAHALPGILIEMLVGSDESGIDLLPALPATLRRGSITGVETRCGATLRRLEWDLDKGEARVTLVSRTGGSLQLRTPGGGTQAVKLRPGRPAHLTLKLPRP